MPKQLVVRDVNADVRKDYDGTGGVERPVVLPDTNVTLAAAEANRRLVQTPTSGSIITLPSVGVIAGDIVDLHNLAASVKMTPESSDGDDIASFQNGAMKLMATQAIPTDRTHWRILNVFGGASPRFSAHRNSVAQLNLGVVLTKVKFTTELIDNNNDFSEDADDSGGATESRFTPTVPGGFKLMATVGWQNAVSVDDKMTIAIFKNGVIYRQVNKYSVTSLGFHSPITCEVEANGLSDFFEAFAADETVAAGGDVDGNPINTFFEGYRIGT